MISLAPILSKSSLNTGDHEELKIFLSNCLIPSQFNQELRKIRGDTSVFKGEFPRDFRAV